MCVLGVGELDCVLREVRLSPCSAQRLVGRRQRISQDQSSVCIQDVRLPKKKTDCDRGKKQSGAESDKPTKSRGTKQIGC